jgi:hypothetical protein
MGALLPQEDVRIWAAQFGSMIDCRRTRGGCCMTPITATATVTIESSCSTCSVPDMIRRTRALLAAVASGDPDEQLRACPATQPAVMVLPYGGD